MQVLRVCAGAGGGGAGEGCTWPAGGVTESPVRVAARSSPRRASRTSKAARMMIARTDTAVSMPGHCDHQRAVGSANAGGVAAG